MLRLLWTKAFRRHRLLCSIEATDLSLGLYLMLGSVILASKGSRFQMLSFADDQKHVDDVWAHLVPWSRSSVEWGPVYSHVSLSEGSRGDFVVAPEVLQPQHQFPTTPTVPRLSTPTKTSPKKYLKRSPETCPNLTKSMSPTRKYFQTPSRTRPCLSVATKT